MKFGVSWTPSFSIPCGSSVGASPPVRSHAVVRRSFQYPLRIERGCKPLLGSTCGFGGGTFSIPCGSSVGASPAAFHAVGQLRHLSVSPADRAWVQEMRWRVWKITPPRGFQYPLRIERGCKMTTADWLLAVCGPFSIPCGSSVGASWGAPGTGKSSFISFQYPLRIERGCKSTTSGQSSSRYCSFSIPCGSSVGASVVAGGHPAGAKMLSVSPADRAWVQDQTGRPRPS